MSILEGACPNLRETETKRSSREEIWEGTSQRKLPTLRPGPPGEFEKMYMSPANKVDGNLKSMFGNPTPLGLLGMNLSVSPLCCQLMGWAGAGGGGAATVSVHLAYLFASFKYLDLTALDSGTFYFIGGFWFSFGATLTPAYNAMGAYNPSNSMNPEFHSSYAFFALFMGFLCFVYLICSFRINCACMIMFLSMTLGFWLMACTYWLTARGSNFAESTQIATGGALFVTSMSGWYYFVAELFSSIGIMEIPVGDLSRFAKRMGLMGSKD
ncbi:hypothetical protein KC331_g211 [Hortaea werneckii]|nr:hypothetical protein KC361_g8531 [Hortaea werneckii]KAI6830397.1 hypothetical protein KC342_g8449 [Hortaea werneckii]KAI6847842.1 hypothetical protein KC350_g3253 [Hortaea werneckii]KAI7152707.1 hypothetical protein KC349_g8819 [Hortaea werneckii]KAI7554912.1 hypothetical protein KC331_g211 [Hortaea werneckii]